MKQKIISIIIAALFFTCAGTTSAMMNSANFSITSSVMSGGGGSMTSASFASHTIMGQPSPVMDTDNPPVSAGYNLYPGYIYTLGPGTICPWDLDSPMDGDVDGLDLFYFINDGYDISVWLDEFSSEFGRDDCF